MTHRSHSIASSCALGFMTNISWALINTYSYSFVYIGTLSFSSCNSACCS